MPDRSFGAVTRRFTSRQALIIGLGGALIVAAAGALLAAAWLDVAFTKATIVHWDVATARRIHDLVTPRGTRFFETVSRLGSPTTMTWLTILASLFLLVTRRFQLAIVWLAAFGGGAALETLLKDAVQRTRPEYATHYLAIGSYSFPSGHATLSSIAMAMVVYSLSVTNYLRGVARTIAAIIAALWVLLVGTSRLYLGLHYPSDVLGGLVIGGAWFLVCVLVVNVAVRRRSPAPSNG